MKVECLVRPATSADMSDVTVIYAYFVATSTATFEIVVPDDSVGAKLLLASTVHAYLTSWEAACTIRAGFANEPSEWASGGLPRRGLSLKAWIAQ